MLNPLSYGRKMWAVGVGFEPTIPCGIPVFETSALGHYATPPQSKVRLRRDSNSQPQHPQRCALSIVLRRQNFKSMRIVLKIGKIAQSMKREFSAGGIVLKDGKVLLIKNAALRDPKKAYWGFPKGHINPREKSSEAALREIKEETGIEAEIVKKLGDSQYVFTRSGEKVFKQVVYYLLKFKSGDIQPQELEVLEVKWFDPEEAMELLTFKKDKEMLNLSLGIAKSWE